MNRRDAKRRACAAVADALAAKRVQLAGRTDADARRALDALEELEREMTRRARRVRSPEPDPRQLTMFARPAFDATSEARAARARQRSYAEREATKPCEWPRDVPIPPQGGCPCFPCASRRALTEARRA